MQITHVFAFFTLSVIVKGNLVAAMARPMILSFGTIFAAMNKDVLETGPIEWRNILPFSTK